MCVRECAMIDGVGVFRCVCILAGDDVDDQWMLEDECLCAWMGCVRDEMP